MDLGIVKEIKEEINFLEELTKRRPHYIRGHIRLGVLNYRLYLLTNVADQGNLLGLEEIFSEIEMWEAVIRKRPDYILGHVQLGVLYYQRDMIQKDKEPIQETIYS